MLERVWRKGTLSHTVGGNINWCYHYGKQYESKNISHSVVSNSLQPIAYKAPLSIHGILQARILEWVAIPFSRGFSKHKE